MDENSSKSMENDENIYENMMKSDEHLQNSGRFLRFRVSSLGHAQNAWLFRRCWTRGVTTRSRRGLRRSRASCSSRVRFRSRSDLLEALERFIFYKKRGKDMAHHKPNS